MGFRKHQQHHAKADTGFGRFALNTIVVAILLCLVGFGAMWYLADGEGKIKKPSLDLQVAENPIMKVIPEKYRGMFTAKPEPGKGYLFYTADAMTLTPVMVKLERNEAHLPDLAKMLFKAMAGGLGSGTMRSALPEGTELKSVYLNGTTLILNMNRAYIDNMADGLNTEILAVYCLVNTMMVNMDGINAVRIVVEGEVLPVAHADVDISGDLIGNIAVLSAN